MIKLIPKNAMQFRYVIPLYEENEDGDDYCINEEVATIIEDYIYKVDRTKIPMYYRRRDNSLARDHARKYLLWVFELNLSWRTRNWDSWIKVVPQKIGRRVLLNYNPNFWHKIFNKLQKDKVIHMNRSILSRITDATHSELEARHRGRENSRLDRLEDELFDDMINTEWDENSASFNWDNPSASFQSIVEGDIGAEYERDE